ncbi:Chorismate dehydratase [hydrothermal vent metagenome]|uniref:Chorismate dehydratase n=1 Tax=hydrothermal vent metagenome TaxID=652676 RepID=A0A3B1E0D1_9ZZZZ
MMNTISSENFLRIGAVRYLNSKPLIEGLESHLPFSELRLDYPSLLADDLSEGLLDLALVPSIETIRHSGYKIVSNACVAACGPVQSVMLYSRVPLHNISRLALDAGSRTSAILVQILLARRFGITPEIELLPISHSVEECSADAVLLIGDRALHPPRERFNTSWDLGEEWFHQTGLPFVFACWVSPNNNCSDKVIAALNQSRDRGINSLEEIARSASQSLAVDKPIAYRYLRDHLSYHLGVAEKKGLQLFHEMVMEFDILSKAADFQQSSDSIDVGSHHFPLLRQKCA